jgi:hypothetical protein
VCVWSVVADEELICIRLLHERRSILKEKVREHGDRKWAVVAQFLPGRIGKQCRERWTNHLRPDIKVRSVLDYNIHLSPFFLH